MTFKLDEMAAPHNVEFEAAKFLQKLIHESTDEPAKLATKLYVVSSFCFRLSSEAFRDEFGVVPLLFRCEWPYVHGINVSDIAAHESQWERKFYAIPSNIKVSNFHLRSKHFTC